LQFTKNSSVYVCKAEYWRIVWTILDAGWIHVHVTFNYGIGTSLYIIRYTVMCLHQITKWHIDTWITKWIVRTKKIPHLESPIQFTIALHYIYWNIFVNCKVFPNKIKILWWASPALEKSFWLICSKSHLNCRETVPLTDKIRWKLCIFQ